MRFYYVQNNGIVAVISEDHVKIHARDDQRGTNPQDHEAKVFTFCSVRRYNEDPTARLFFTGTHEDLGRLISAGEHELVEGCPSGWNGMVPFSNYEQIREEVAPHDLIVDKRFIRHVCNLTDVIDVFGIQAVAGLKS